MYDVLWNVCTFPLSLFQYPGLSHFEKKNLKKLWRGLTAESNRVAIPSPPIPCWNISASNEIEFLDRHNSKPLFEMLSVPNLDQLTFQEWDILILMMS